MSVNLNQSLREILSPAYAPCSGFASVCYAMRWMPERGHIPRAFWGALGDLKEVELVLVCSEPGDPYPDEIYTDDDKLDKAFETTYLYLENSRERFETNLRQIMEFCWPTLDLDDQLRRIWITNSVLCSAEYPTAQVPSSISTHCITRYLKRQLDLFPNALVVALGGKAQKRLRENGISYHLGAYSPAIRPKDQAMAEYSWKAIATELHKRI